MPSTRAEESLSKLYFTFEYLLYLRHEMEINDSYACRS